MQKRTTRSPHWTQLLILLWVALLCLPVTASADETTTSDEEEVRETLLHPPRRSYRRRRVIVVRPPRRPPPRRRLVVVEPEAEPTRRDVLGIGLRLSGTGLDGQKLGLSDLENPAMAGFGLQLRSRISGHWGLELSADYLIAAENDTGFSQTTVPVMLSAIFNVLPDSAINPYVLAGAGVHFTSLSYLDGQFEHHILEVAGQLGAGVEVKLGDSLALHADIRFLSVYKNLGSVTEVSSGCLSSHASETGFCNGLANLDPEDKFNIGAQFQAGATYYF